MHGPCAVGWTQDAALLPPNSGVIIGTTLPAVAGRVSTGAVPGASSPAHTEPVWVTVATPCTAYPTPLPRYVGYTPAMFRTPGSENGTITSTASTSAVRTSPWTPPPNVTPDTPSSLSRVVEPIVSTDPPWGVVLESVPGNSLGTSKTVVLVSSDPDVNVTVVAPPSSLPVTRNGWVPPSGNGRLVSGATYAMVTSADLAVTSAATGCSCPSRTTTTIGAPVGSAIKVLGVTLSAEGPFLSDDVGSPLHAHIANAIPERIAPLQSRGIVIPRAFL